MFKYIVKKEQFEVRFPGNYEAFRSNFDKLVGGEREQKSIAVFDSAEDAVKAFDVIIEINPPFMPRRMSSPTGDLAYITLWEIDRLEYEDGEEDFGEINAVDFFTIKSYDNFPTRQQFDESVNPNDDGE